MSGEVDKTILLDRRSFLGNSGKIALSGTAIALMSGMTPAKP